MIHYTLRENILLTDSGQRVARVHRLDPVELDALVDQIVQHGSTVGRADIFSVLDDYHATIENLLLMGMSVNTPTANYRVGIEGIFADEDDGFDPSRHRVMARVSAGSRLRKTLRTRAQVVKDELPPPGPNPRVYTDVVSKTKNEVLTPGEGARLTGHRLRFDPDDPAQGLFLLAMDGTATRVDRLIKVMPSEVSLIAPVLPAGPYALEVRTGVNGSGEIRKGQLEALLTVS